MDQPGIGHRRFGFPFQQAGRQSGFGGPAFHDNRRCLSAGRQIEGLGQPGRPAEGGIDDDASAFLKIFTGQRKQPVVGRLAGKRRVYSLAICTWIDGCGRTVKQCFADHIRAKHIGVDNRCQRRSNGAFPRGGQAADHPQDRSAEGGGIPMGHGQVASGGSKHAGICPLGAAFQGR